MRLNVVPELARWRDTLEWMLDGAHLLKISDEDLGLLMPGTTPDDFAADALARGVGLVVVTRGGEGALGWTRGAAAAAPPTAVHVVDTVGAGDTFQAALLTWLAEHGRLSPAAVGALDAAELAEALGFAARAAADHLQPARRRHAEAARGLNLARGAAGDPSGALRDPGRPAAASPAGGPGLHCMANAASQPARSAAATQADEASHACARRIRTPDDFRHFELTALVSFSKNLSRWLCFLRSRSHGRNWMHGDL